MQNYKDIQLNQIIDSICNRLTPSSFQLYLTALLFAIHFHATWLIVTFSIFCVISGFIKFNRQFGFIKIKKIKE